MKVISLFPVNSLMGERFFIFTLWELLIGIRNWEALEAEFNKLKINVLKLKIKVSKLKIITLKLKINSFKMKLKPLPPLSPAKNFHPAF
jgi:hypothetical protein